MGDRAAGEAQQTQHPCLGCWVDGFDHSCGFTGYPNGQPYPPAQEASDV